MYRLLRNPRLRYGCATAGIAGAGIWAVNARESPLPAGLHTGPRSFLAPLGISTPALSLWPGGNSLFGAPGWFSSRGEDSLSRALEEALGPAGSSSPEQPPPRARFIRKRGPVSSEGTLLTEALLGANGIVWALHQVPSLQSFMMANFASTPRNLSEGVLGWARMLACTFSHKSFVHLACNMLGLWSFAPHIMRTYSVDAKSPVLSAAEFMAMYVTAGMAGAVASAAFHRSLGMNIPALGASGSIFGVLGYFCLANPDAQLLLLFVIPASGPVGSLIAVGGNLFLVFRTWRMARAGIFAGGIDGMAHLAGHAVGAAWYLKRRAEESVLSKAGAPPGSSSGPGGSTITSPFSAAPGAEDYTGSPHRSASRGGSRYAEDDFTSGSDGRGFGAGEGRPRGGGGVSV